MSFLGLSDELLLQIFNLRRSNTKDVWSIILTCHRFYRVALRDILYREININASILRDRKFLHAITIHPERASSVREASFFWDGDDAKAWELVFDIIPKLLLMNTLGLHVEGPTHSEGERRFQFSHYLDRLANLQIRKLWIANKDLTSEEIARLSTILTIEHMRIYWFDGDLSDRRELVLSSKLSNIPPSNVVKLEFLSTESPLTLSGPSILGKFPCLQELTWEYSEEDLGDFSPILFISPLLPIAATLAKLNLSVEFAHPTSCQLNLSQFTALKVLRLHERLAFKFNLENEWVWEGRTEQEIEQDRLDLSERLPATLEQLEIIFVYSSCCLRQLPTTEADPRWILALAYNRGTYLKRLSTVTLIEGDDMPEPEWYASDPPVSEYLRNLIEWNYPQEVILAYQDAGIRLAVLCEKSRNDCDCIREGRFS